MSGAGGDDWRKRGRKGAGKGGHSREYEVGIEYRDSQKRLDAIGY